MGSSSDFNMLQNDMAQSDPGLFSNIVNGTADVLASGGLGLYNTGVALLNTFGADISKVDTSQFIGEYIGEDAKQLYNDNKELIDFGGMVVGSLIPGGFGVTAAKTLRAGKFLQSGVFSGLENGFAAKYATQAVELRRFGNTVFDPIDAVRWKYRLGAVADAVYENAVAGTFIAASMNQHPTLNKSDMSYWDSFGHNVWDMVNPASSGLGSAFIALDATGRWISVANKVRKGEAAAYLARQPNVAFNPYDNVNIPQGSRVNFLVSDAFDVQQQITQLEAARDGGLQFGREEQTALRDLKAKHERMWNAIDGHIADMQAKGSGEDILQLVQSTIRGMTADQMNSSLPAIQKFGRVDPARFEDKFGMMHTSTSGSKPPGNNGTFFIGQGNIELSDKLNEEAFVRVFLHEEGHARTISTEGTFPSINSILGITKAFPDAAPEAGPMVFPEVFNRLFGSRYLDRPDMLHLPSADAVRNIAKEAGITDSKTLNRIVTIQQSLEALSREARPRNWEAVDQAKDILGNPEKAKTYTNAQIAQLQETLNYTPSLSELLADAYSVLARPGIEQHALMAEHKQLVRALKGSDVLQNLYGPNKLAYDSYAAKLMPKESPWSAGKVVPQVADIGPVKLFGSTLQFGGHSVNLQEWEQALAKLKPGDTPDIRNIPDVQQMDALWAGHELKWKTASKDLPVNPDNPFDVQGALGMATRENLSQLKLTDGTVASTEELRKKLVAWKNEEMGKILSNNSNERLTPGGFKPTDQQIQRMFNVDWYATKGDVRNANYTIYSDFDPTKPRHFEATTARDFKFNDTTIRSELGAQNNLKLQEDMASGTAIQFLSQFGKAGEFAADIAQGRNTGYFSDRGVLDSVTGASSQRGFLNFMNSAIGTFGSIAQVVGRRLDEVHQFIRQSTKEAGTAAAQGLATNAAARAEFNVINSQILRGANKYQLLTAADMDFLTGPGLTHSGQNSGYLLVNRDMLKELEAVSKLGNQQAITDLTNNWMARKNSVVEIKNNETAAFYKWWHKAMGTATEQRNGLNATQGRPNRFETDFLYVPQQNPNDFTHVLWVKAMMPDADGILQTEHVGAILGRDAADLVEKQALLSRSRPDLKVLTKDDVVAWKKARGEYDPDEMMRDRHFNTELRREGVLTGVLPRSDMYEVENMINHLANFQIDSSRKAITLQFGREIGELQQMANMKSAYETSKFQGMNRLTRWISSGSDNAYQATIDTLLNVNRRNYSGVYEQLSSTLESGFSQLTTKIGRTWNEYKSGDDNAWQAVNKAMEDKGFTPAYKTAMEMAMVDTTPRHGDLSKFIGKSNAVIATLQLGIDTMQALVNAVSLPVLLIPELISARNLTSNPEFKALTTVTDPKTGVAVPSNTRMIANAISDFFSEAGKAKRDYYNNLGVMGRSTEAAQLALKDIEVPIQAFQKNDGGWTAVANQKANSAIEKLRTFSGTKFSEDFVRYVAAHTADQMFDVINRAGTSLDRAAFINTMVNRVHGNYTAAQKPGLFQGVIGQAITLFQTYQFNMTQQAMRHWGEGDKKAFAMMVGLQGSLFGLRSVPGFSAINQHLVGENSPEQRDAISRIYGLSGKDPVMERRYADWIVYGAASNIAHVDLFNRADLNPRTPTIVPVTFSELPIVNFASNFFGNIYNLSKNISNSGFNGNTVLEAVAHNGVSRPLAGLATDFLGYRTTGKGDKFLFGRNDLDWLGKAAAVLGGKHIDEAIVLDTMYRKLGYDSNQAANMESLGASLRGAIRAGGDTIDQSNVIKKYMANGGRMENYARWFMDVSKGATQSQLNQLYQKQLDPANQNAMKIIGTDRGLQYNHNPGAYFPETPDGSQLQ